MEQYQKNEIYVCPVCNHMLTGLALHLAIYDKCPKCQSTDLDQFERLKSGQQTKGSE